VTIYDYKYALDHLIIDILYTEGSYRYRALKKRIEEPLSHEISFDTYDRHIDRLTELLIVERKKEGKKVFYSLIQESKNNLDRGQKIDTTM
jgi:DNA-binding transcriptional ArsR family regulator